MEHIDFMYITNNPQIASAIDGIVKRIWVDLEYLGKEERQKGMNTVKSNHTLADISLLRSHITKSELLVRVNPIHPNSEQEINEAIDRGADILMLPMFKSTQEVSSFLAFVNGRVKTTLLFETKESVELIDEILAMKGKGINEVHVGLNDLHLSYGLTFMFELLANGTVEKLCKIFQAHNIPYGFGGIAKIGEGLLPAEKILAEHIRLKSSRVILSRSFCDTIPNDILEWKNEFEIGIKKIRDNELLISNWASTQFKQNITEIQESVNNIVDIIKKRSNA